MSGAFLALCGVTGRFDAQYSYCDRTTTPCTQVSAPVWYGIRELDAHFTPGSGLSRTIASLLGMAFCGVSILVSASALDKEQVLFALELEAKALEAASSVLLKEEELEKVAIASEMRVKDFQRELTDGYAYLHLEKNPHLIDELTRQPEPKDDETDTPVSPPIPEPSASVPEPLEPKIPPGIHLMLDSDLREVIDAGILNLVGAQGSGKTSTSCMVLRYRIWKGVGNSF